MDCDVTGQLQIICVNNYPTRCNNIQLIYICKFLYMFRGGIFHPSSGAPITVSTVSGIIDIVTATCRESDAPDDGWRYHPETCRAV